MNEEEADEGTDQGEQELRLHVKLLNGAAFDVLCTASGARRSPLEAELRRLFDGDMVGAGSAVSNPRDSSLATFHLQLAKWFL